MSDVWTQSEGQIVDSLFRLQKYLAGTEHSAVFLTELPPPKSKKAAIKFIAADPATADRQLSAWTRVSKLSHPHLLQTFQFGRCRLERMDLLYVVMQYAEEDISQVLPDRALTISETREMLGPVLEALSYIHAKGFLHAHITPANVLAAGDQLKLAADTIIPSGDARLCSRKLDIYDAPETESSPPNTLSDVWSLGATLVEVLTRRPPVLPLDNQSNPNFPDTLPQPFLDIACHTLRRDPKRRWTTAEISARLKQTAAAAAAGQTQPGTAMSPPATSPAAAGSPPASPLSSATAAGASTVSPATATAAVASPLAVPLSNMPAVPAAKLPTPGYQVPTQKVPPRPQPVQATPKISNRTAVLPNYILPLAAAMLIIAAIFMLPKILGGRPDSSSSMTPASASPTQPKPAPPSHSATTQPDAKPATLGSVTPVPEKPLPSAAAALGADTPALANAAHSSRGSRARGEVLDQVLPEVSEKARATIVGRVHVGVRAQVDAAGNVSDVELDTPGPSKYFADLAVKAARRWEFNPPEIGGRSVPSEWLIRFVFSQTDIQAYPKQITP